MQDENIFRKTVREQFELERGINIPTLARELEGSFDQWTDDEKKGVIHLGTVEKLKMEARKIRYRYVPDGQLPLPGFLQGVAYIPSQDKEVLRSTLHLAEWREAARYKIQKGEESIAEGEIMEKFEKEAIGLWPAEPWLTAEQVFQNIKAGSQSA